MKKNIYSLFLVLIAMAAFTACSSDDNDYKGADVPGNAQVYFSKDLPKTQNILMSESSFTVPVNRVKTDDAITVPITLESDDDFFTAPSSLSFAAGESTSYLTISYDPSKLVYDDFKKATLTITDASYTSEYGATSYTFSAGALSPFKELGKGTLAEDYYWGYETEVTIYQNEEDPSTYRIYGATEPVVSDGSTPSPYLEIKLLQPGDTYADVTITQENLVAFEDFNTGYHHSTYDADIMWYHPSGFSSLRSESNWLHSVVLAYDENGNPGQVQLAPLYYMDGVGGWNASQTDGAIVITFPGYAPKDYSAEFACYGVLTDLSGAVYAEGLLELGADATDVRAVVVPADADPEAVADAIASGDVEATALTAGNVYIPIADGMTGKLQVVVVVFDEEAKIKGIYSAVFEYYGGGDNPWKSIGTGILTDNFVVTMYYEDADAKKVFDPKDYEVEILENSNEPGLYRIVKAFEGVTKYIKNIAYTPADIEVNATDPDGVYILQQSTGVADSDGEISIITHGARYLSNYSVEELKGYGYLGKLSNGVITFPHFNHKNSSTGEVDFTYQGLFIIGSSSYYAGTDGDLKIVLPQAVTAKARAKARAQAKANSFARRLSGMKQLSMKEMRILKNQNAPLMKATRIAE